MSTAHRKSGISCEAAERQLRLWYEREDGPTAAERAFLRLARIWHETVTSSARERSLPREADETALACLLLAHEWSAKLGEPAATQARANLELLSLRAHTLELGSFDSPSRIDALPWQLCDCGVDAEDRMGDWIDSLISALTHHQSSIRCWMMEIGWMVRAILPPERTVPQLLKNVADTLGGVRLAMGLASALCSSDQQLEQFIEGFEAPDGFANQFEIRMKAFRAEGFPFSQAYFWELESRCRRRIEHAAF